MKKIFAAILSIAMMIPVSANAGIIQASSKSCKVGSTKSDSTYKYVCVTPGVWKKTLIPVKVIPIKPAASPQMETATPVTTIIVATAPKIFNIDNLTPSLVFSKSRESIAQAIASSAYSVSGITFNVGPNVDKSKVNVEKQTLEQTAKLWGNLYKPNNNVQIVFYNYQDLDWAKTKVTQLSASASLYSANSCTSTYCGNASAGLLTNGIWLFEEGLGGGLRNRSTSAHEYTHLAQGAFDPQYWTDAPLWLVEGMAQFYGEAIGYGSFDSNNQTRLESHRGLAQDYQFGTSQTIKSLLEKNDIANTNAIMQSIEFPSPRYTAGSLPLSYVVGGYATEVLVAVYGQQSMEKFVSSFASSKDWQKNFKDSFGLTKDEFYAKITTYLAEVSKEL